MLCAYWQDVLTSLRSATMFGRANYDLIFQEISDSIAADHDIGVFFCGPPALGSELRMCLAVMCVCMWLD